MSQQNGHGHRHGSLIRLLHEIGQRSWMVRIEHVLRQGNFVADTLAKGASRSDFDRHFITTPANVLIPLLQFDLDGMTGAMV
ncbi:hypothetical protein GQ457_12G012770 [Hibiscus cannabinus]